MMPIHELEEYGKEPKKSRWVAMKEKIKELWNKTIFPDKIRAMKEEREWKRQLQKEVKQEVREESKELFKKQMVEAEMAKLKKKSRPMAEKVAEGFSMGGQGQPGSGSQRIVDMMGTGQGSSGNSAGDKMGGAGFFSDDKIKKMLGTEDKEEEDEPKKKEKKKKEKKNPMEYNDKIAEMLK